MKKRNILILLLVVVLAFSGCGGGGAKEDGGTDSKTLVIGIQDEIEGADIQQIGWENIVQSLIYEPLVVFSPDLSEMQPAFAESYEIAEDGLSITFVLPEDAKFSNGDPCDAEAVKKSTERFLKISEYAGDLEAVKSIDAVDARTVRYNLSEPAPYMWASITSTYGGLVDVAVAETMTDDEFNRMPVTNGPYKVKEWTQGSEIVLERNENYKTSNPNVENKDLANFDTIVVRFIPDEFTRVSELESGNVDIIYDVPSSSIADLEANKDLTTYRYEQTGVFYLNLQTEKGATADLKVREAINYGINKDEIASALDNVVTPMYGFISSAQAGYSDTKEKELAKKYAYDQEKAIALLKEAGWTDSDKDGIVDKNGEKLSIEMLTSSDRATIKAAAPVIQTQLQAIGIDLQIREYESAYIKQMMKDNTYTMGTRTFEWNDADILYYVFTEASGYAWSNPAVTDALTKARYMTDPATRVAGYEVAQDAIMSTMKSVPLFADNHCVAAKANIKGLQITNDGRTFIHDVTKE